jgi:hypothetical protein|tara:strand:+ start:1011 stop:1208 length:198 start_codon:yes stop_codon:yes gene_type:complete
MPKTKAHAGYDNLGRTTRRVMAGKGITDPSVAKKAAKEGLKSSREHEARAKKVTSKGSSAKKKKK